MLKKTMPLVLLFLFFFSVSCKKLDEDGGYYDEKTKKYKYVSVGRKVLSNNPLGVKKPVNGKSQVFSVNFHSMADTNTIWIYIEDRQSYMILANSLDLSNRRDADKLLRIELEYVDPKQIPIRDSDFRSQWIDYVIGVMNKLLKGQSIVVNAVYFKSIGSLSATVFLEVDGVDVNINRWMIENGLSRHILSREGEPHPNLIEAEETAKSNKSGIWQHL